MKIEHVALNVSEPTQAAKWYTENLGMTIVKGLDKSPFTHFLADSSGQVMVEFYNNPLAPVPDYYSIHPLTLHIAFLVDNMEATRARLMAAGARAEGDISSYDNGDQLAMLRDPWGVTIQLAKRGRPMI
jgi:catechol 2,3-dioxygenase-like lactoylglutathione lyase family enzyme